MIDNGLMISFVCIYIIIMLLIYIWIVCDELYANTTMVLLFESTMTFYGLLFEDCLCVTVVFVL